MTIGIKIKLQKFYVLFLNHNIPVRRNKFRFLIFCLNHLFKSKLKVKAFTIHFPINLINKYYFVKVKTQMFDLSNLQLIIEFYSNFWSFFHCYSATLVKWIVLRLHMSICKNYILSNIIFKRIHPKKSLSVNFYILHWFYNL